MKAFAIFPTICVFALTLTLYNFDRQIKFRNTLLIAFFFAIVFGSYMTFYSSKLFPILYVVNIFGVFILTPCLTYWVSKLISSIGSKKVYWMKIIGVGIASALLSSFLFVLLMWNAFLHNPTD